MQEDLGGLLVANPGGNVSTQLLRVVADDPGAARTGEDEVVGAGAVRGQAQNAVALLNECPGACSPLGLLLAYGLNIVGLRRQRPPQMALLR